MKERNGIVNKKVVCVIIAGAIGCFIGMKLLFSVFESMPLFGCIITGILAAGSGLLADSIAEKSIKKSEERTIKSGGADFIRAQTWAKTKVSLSSYRSEGDHNITIPEGVEAVLIGPGEDNQNFDHTGKDGLTCVIIKNTGNGEFYSVANGRNKNLMHGYPTLSVKRYKAVLEQYHPSDLRYSSVSVGGVTTGGVYDVGNYYSQHSYTTGAYTLDCKIDTIYFSVFDIYLGKRLLEKAKENSIISGLIEPNTNHMKLLKQIKQEYSNHLSANMNFHDAQNLIMMDSASMMLTNSEAQAIKDLLLS